MLILIIFAFIAGVVTILSPCILPLLPIILATSTGGSKKKPLGIVLGFVLSFTLATVTLSSLVKLLGIDANLLRYAAITLLIAFGLTLALPQLNALWSKLASRLASRSTTSSNKTGFLGGMAVGLSLGLLWTPCVGPILASVITLAATSTITAATFFITLAYALGTAIPLFAVLTGAGWLMNNLTFLKTHSRVIEQVFGVIMVITALLIWFGLDRRFQNYILAKFPNYGTGLTQIEQNKTVQNNLESLKKNGGNMNNLIDQDKAPELLGGGNWINLPTGTSSLTLEGLRGKVVLVDFWTYSCVNCIRTLPFLKAWDDKYRNSGLAIIGVHSPEFEFEKDLGNVQSAVQDFGIGYPVVQDNDFRIWRAYNNHYWPAKYLVDKDGVIRYTHFGEGNYDETERAIQDLLGEKTTSLVDMPEYKSDTRSPETYVGYNRISNLVSSPPIKKDLTASYITPPSFPTNGIGFQGEWQITPEYGQSYQASSLFFRFDAAEVNLVMAPALNQNTNGTPTHDSGVGAPTAEVYVDGEKITTLTIDKNTLYNLVKLDQRENHVIEIKFPEGGVRAYAFTFG